MFQVGDMVRYGQSGVCRVDGVREMTIAGTSQRYYVLSPLFKAGSLVYVPVENRELVEKMLPPLTKEEVGEIFDRVKGMRVEWIRDFRRRSDFSKKALSSGDRAEALYLIKSIYHHKRESLGQGTRIHTTDDYFLKDAENLIYSEIAYVMEKNYDEVAAEVRALLMKE